MGMNDIAQDRVMGMATAEQVGKGQRRVEGMARGQNRVGGRGRAT